MGEKDENTNVDDLFNEFDVLTEDVVEPVSDDETPTDNLIEVVKEPVVTTPEVATVLQTQYNELNDKFLRIYADFENFKKRVLREKQDHTKFANENLLRELLPVLDNLTRAVSSARKTGEAPAIAAGVDMVVQEFTKVLKRAGVEPMETVGQPFDPSFHEALQQIETDNALPGTVVNEILRGYLLHGRVLRPALVAVAKAPEKTHPGIKIDDLKQ